MAKSKTFDTRNDLNPDVRSTMISLLNQHLADTFDLYSQIKQAHWNVKGAQFHQLHQFYDELAVQVLEWVDTIAERATALGGAAQGTVRMAADATRLAEFPTAFEGIQTVEALAIRYAGLAQTTRKAIDTAADAGDQSTADVFTEVSRGLDKSLWFLEAHLQA